METKSDKYQMPISKGLFDAVECSGVFSTLDLRSGYHEFPLLAGDRVSLWEVDEVGMDQLYHWKFIIFGLKNALAWF